jgi:hypothetical protein
MLFQNGHWRDGTESWLTDSDCETKQDLGAVLCPRIGITSRCNLFSPWGTRVTSCADVSADDNIFAVPEGRLFIMPTKGVGHRTEIHHLPTANGQPITLETLSESPRILRMRNFFTATEARTLIKSITHPTSPETALPPIESPTIIDDYNRIVFSRTGEAYYDGTSELATTLRRRAFDLLGIFPFEEMLAEGFQVSLSLFPSRSLALALFLFLSFPPPPPPSFFVYILLSATLIWIFFLVFSNL